MRPLLTIALTAILGISLVVAYRVYQVGKHRKNRKKVAPNRKLKRTEPPVVQTGSGEKGTSLRHSGSDILHPAPFDNVTGTMSVPKCTENSKRLSKEDDSAVSISDTTKLQGSRMDSESLEIKKMPYSFEKCETATFEPAEKKKSTDELPSSVMAKTSDSEQPKVTAKSGDDSPKLVEKKSEEQPKIVEKSTEEPKSDEKPTNEPIKVTEKSEDQPPKKGEKKSEEPLKIAEKSTDEPPKVAQKSSDEPTKNTELPNNEPAKITEEPPKTDEQKPQEQPKIDEKPTNEPIKVTEKAEGQPPKSEEKIAEKSTDEPPKVTETIAPLENKMARMMGSNEKSSSNESAEPSKFPVPPPLLQTAPSLENTASPSSPASLNPSSALNDHGASASSSASSTGDPSKSLYKACRCRKNARGSMLANSDAPSYDSGLSAEIPETKVLPLNFSKYEPPNLLEPPGKKDGAVLKELPDELFAVVEPKTDTYLTPLYPVLGAIHAAHNHACLINNLIENYDFFQ